MNISIELLYGVAVVKNKGAIPITSDPLILTLNSNGSLKDLFVTATNANKSITFEAIDGVAVMPESLKISGVLRLTIRQIINGEVLRNWIVEQILLKELDGTYEAIPQVTELAKQVTALTEAVAELKKIIIENGEF